MCVLVCFCFVFGFVLGVCFDFGGVFFYFVVYLVGNVCGFGGGIVGGFVDGSGVFGGGVVYCVGVICGGIVGRIVYVFVCGVDCVLCVVLGFF